MSVSDNQEPQEPQKSPNPKIIKVIFGWPAWIFLFLLFGGLGEMLQNSIEKSSQQNVELLEREADSLRTEVEQLQSKIDQLLDKTGKSNPEAE